ncbi:MAG: VOC family protein [Acidimicrobiales bacterium]|jgi:predicted enzyme related to lactoylglutathione lyase
MPEMTRYEHGVPSWVDIGTPDPEAGVKFYSELFGWESHDMGEESGHYTIVSKAGKQVAAISGAQDPGPPHWTTYVNVDDVDAVAAKVEPAGGSVIFGPMDVMAAGRMAIFQDTTGATIAAWQPGEHIGAQLVNEPGAFIWDELSSSDTAKSKKFYSEVFGWGWGGSDEYAEAQVGGRTIGGMMPRPEGMPAEAPDGWTVYFGSTDVDEETKKATELGATVLLEPTDIPGTGRFALLMDPQGAAFALFKG